MDAISIALGGMRAAATQFGQAANAIAGLHASVVMPSATPQSPPATGYQPLQVGTLPPDDLAKETVNMLYAKQAYRANIASIKTQEEMTDRLFEIIS